MENKSNLSAWSLMGLIALLGMLGLLVSVSVFAATVQINIDPASAVQHIDSVKIMQTDNDGDEAILKSEGAGLLRIQTNANILLGVDNQIVDNSTNSTILGGTNNIITGGQDSTIIAGASNSIDNSGEGGSNTILGGQGNEIGGSSFFSTIAGGLRNRIVGMLSTIVGGSNNQITGDYSVIVGQENSVVGNNSVAVGKNSKVNANNSFLWTDSMNNGELNADDVFAVVSRRGMVVNALAPNENAQLTIGGPLVVSMNNNDENVICESGQGAGTMKTVLTGGRYCLCSCDGNSRNSMFGQGQCQSICHGEPMQPVCGTGVERVDCDSVYKFRGSCQAGYVVEGTGAYLVDKHNIVHWTCQTSDGTSVGCSSTVTQTVGCPAPCEDANLGHIPDGQSVQAYSSNSPTGTCDVGIRTCNAGVLEGDPSYNLPTCTEGCKIPWSNDYISNGSSLEAFEAPSAPVGSCRSQLRTCNDGGRLSGSWIYEECVPQSATNCYNANNGLWYAHGSGLVTYTQDNYQCPDGCRDGGHAIAARCYNGKWLNASPEYWISDTQLKSSVVPDDIKVDLNYYSKCDSQNSSNATKYTLLECPSQGTCLSGTVSLGGQNPNNSCTNRTMYELDKCNANYYKSGDTCLGCPTGYTSDTGSVLYGCIIRCDDAQFLSDIGASSCTSCPVGTYKTGHTVNYGSKSSCYPCDNGPMHSHYTSNSTGNNCSWVCDAGFNKVGNECVGSCGTYSPSAFKVLDMYFLTDSGKTGHYTLMDRNLGATQVYAGIDNICTYGYYYQWGNNYGFANAGSIKTSTEKVDALPYGPSPLNYYLSDTFIKSSGRDWSINQNDNLWGGNGSVIDRRGPCPEGYHIPSYSEFRNIIDNYWGKSVYNTGGSQFALDFLMPFAGFRASNSNVVSQGSTGAYWYSSWSSSYPGSSVHLWFHRSVVPVNSSPRPDGMSIRCTRNSQDSALNIHPNEGKKALIIVHDNKITKLGTPTRDGKTFGGWYWDAGYTSLAYTGQTVPASAHLYAKWN